MKAYFLDLKEGHLRSSKKEVSMEKGEVNRQEALKKAKWHKTAEKGGSRSCISE